ncbi:MAG: hypothetical protein IKT67_13035 [Lachnospiraceae bacterium]|nr:hypothetical protein [Lachnospiraceae bacterium]
MSVTEFKRGVPTYKDKNDNEYGLLCETKEVCVTDNDGVSLEYKLQNLLQNINNIISGANQVGNAKTLDGHGAEYFAPLTSIGFLQKRSEWNGAWTKIEQAAVGLYVLFAENAIVTDLPPNATKDPTTAHHLLVMTYGNQNSYIFTEPSTRKVWFGAVYGSGITWNEIVFEVNLANYLPLYGGGTLSAPLEVILSLMAVASTNSYLQFKGKDGVIGHLGFAGLDNPVFLNATNTAMHNLLHTGNSSKVVISQTAPSDTSALWVW